MLTDRLTFDELGWRGLWAYITAAPPGTAIFHARSEGWSLGDKIAAEQLYEHQKLGAKFGINEMPERPTYPGAGQTEQETVAQNWATATVDDMVSPEVRKLLRGA